MGKSRPARGCQVLRVAAELRQLGVYLVAAREHVAELLDEVVAGGEPGRWSAWSRVVSSGTALGSARAASRGGPSGVRARYKWSGGEGRDLARGLRRRLRCPPSRLVPVTDFGLGVAWSLARIGALVHFAQPGMPAWLLRGPVAPG